MASLTADVNARLKALDSDARRYDDVPPNNLLVETLADLRAVLSEPGDIKFRVRLPDQFRPRNDLDFQSWPGGLWNPGIEIPPIVVQAMSNNSSLLREVTVKPFPGKQEAPVPAIDDLANESPVVPFATAVPSTSSDSIFNSAKLYARKFGCPPYNVSRSLLDDYPSMETNVVSFGAGRNARGMDNFFVNGATNDGAPSGLLQGAYAVEAQNSNAIVLADLYNMVATVPAPYRESKNCVWFCHSQIELQLMQLADSSGRPVWGASGLSKWRVVPNDHMPSEISAGTTPLIFGDLSMFHVGIFGETRFQRAIEKRAEFVEDVFYAWQEADGVLVDPGSHPVVKLQMAA